MSNFRMNRAETSISLSEISLFEKEILHELPEDYKKFLLENNGGQPVPPFFPIAGSKENPFSLVHEFFGLFRARNSSDLRWNYNIYFRRLPSELIAIATDDSGNKICISVRKKDYGSIFFWDHEYEGKYELETSIIKIARDFTDFLGILYQHDVAAELRKVFGEKFGRN